MTKAWMKIALVASALAVGMLAIPAISQDRYPNKAIRLVVPFPAGGSTDIIGSELRAIVAMPDFRESLARNGTDPISTTSAEFAKMIGDDLVRYAKAVKAANIKLD